MTPPSTKDAMPVTPEQSKPMAPHASPTYLTEEQKKAQADKALAQNSNVKS